MAQQRLQTIITIGGNVDNSFGRIGSALVGLGWQIDLVSRKLINFGKESVEKYVNYDDLMREVKALGEYNEAEMAAFDTYNKQIAQTSRHSMEAAASAEGLIAQLGLGIEETRALLPSVLDLSVAAKTDTETALDYLYYSLNAFDMELTESQKLADQMSKTAAIGATDIDSLGGTFQRLGSSLRLFKGGSSEVLAILNGIGQFGEDMQGTKAGRQIRNFMLSLIAPVASKADLLATLNEAGITAEEYEEYISEAGISTEEAAAAMEQMGFTVYDASGQIKPAIQIIDELNKALSAYNEEDRNKILGTIFGKRTYVTASNLLSITKQEYEAWQREILYNSDGFTKNMAETMDEGLGGAFRRLDAARGVLQQTVAKSLEPTIDNMANGLRNMAIEMSNIDPDRMDAIVSGLGTLAVAGPGLIATGLAFRLIGYALTPAGGIGLGIISLFALSNTINKLKEADMAANFGEMKLEAEVLSDHIKSLSDEFNRAYSEVDQYRLAMDGAVESYKTASGTFSRKITTLMLTGAEMTDKDKAGLYNLGAAMHDEVKKGVENSTLASMAYWTKFFSGEGKNDEVYASLIETLGWGHERIIARVEQTAKELGEEMDKAFADNIITGEEWTVIRDKFDEYNKELALMIDAENFVKQQELMRKVQSASYDEIQNLSKEVTDERDAMLEKLTAEYQRERDFAEYMYNARIEAAETEADKNKYIALRDEALRQIDAEFKTKHEGQKTGYDKMNLLIWKKLIEGSGLQETYDALSGYADMVLGGLIPTETAIDEFRRRPGTQRQQVGEYIARGLFALGGYEDIAQAMEYWETQAQSAKSAESRKQLDELAHYYLMAQIASGGEAWGITQDVLWGIGGGNIFTVSGLPTGVDIEKYIQPSAEYSRETALEVIEGLGDDMNAVWQAVGQAITEQDIMPANYAFVDLGEEGRKEFNRLIDQLAEVYDFEKVLAGNAHPLALMDEFREVYAAYELLYGEAGKDSESYRKTPKVDVEMPDGGKSAAGFIAAAQEYLNENPGMWQIGIQGGLFGRLNLFSEGGRATEPSVFGEAGAEWAIPEEHSQRTAYLLDEARKASGFTWGELITRTGGLNAGNRGRVQVVYSPTIYAQDASDVEQKLYNDKERFIKWFEEKELLEGVEVYR